jgi:hypothetical protein
MNLDFDSTAGGTETCPRTDKLFEITRYELSMLACNVGLQSMMRVTANRTIIEAEAESI